VSLHECAGNHLAQWQRCCHAPWTSDHSVPVMRLPPEHIIRTSSHSSSTVTISLEQRVLLQHMILSCILWDASLLSQGIIPAWTALTICTVVRRINHSLGPRPPQGPHLLSLAPPARERVVQADTDHACCLRPLNKVPISWLPV
jgi:hypothetical protein